jgi:hypothetical protein
MDYRQAIEPYVVVLITAGWNSAREIRNTRERVAA